MIAGIVIAKNEEELIDACLKSLAFCDEIVLVDNGSTDKTAEIAKKHKAVITKEESDDFSKLRNTGLSKAKGDWILYIDADERVSPELADEIRLVTQENTKAAYRIKRKNFYLGNHEWPKIEKLERLFVKKNLKEWYGKLHESPKVEGAMGDLNGFILHYSHRNLSQMLEKTIEWSKVEAQLRYDAGHPKMTWWRFPRVMISAFWDSYILQGGFKVGTAGLVESIYQAFSIFITYARLWELQQNKK